MFLQILQYILNDNNNMALCSFNSSGRTELCKSIPYPIAHPFVSVGCFIEAFVVYISFTSECSCFSYIFQSKSDSRSLIAVRAHRNRQRRLLPLFTQKFPHIKVLIFVKLPSFLIISTEYGSASLCANAINTGGVKCLSSNVS